MSIEGRAFFKGKEFSFDLPEGWNLLAMAEPKDVPALADVGAAVRELLANPSGMAPLAEVIKELPHKKTVIISEDQTRPTPVDQILVPLLAELNRQQQVTLIVVSHWPAIAQQMDRVFELRQGRLVGAEE